MATASSTSGRLFTFTCLHCRERVIVGDEILAIQGYCSGSCIAAMKLAVRLGKPKPFRGAEWDYAIYGEEGPIGDG